METRDVHTADDLADSGRSRNVLRPFANRCWLRHGQGLFDLGFRRALIAPCVDRVHAVISEARKTERNEPTTCPETPLPAVISDHRLLYRRRPPDRRGVYAPRASDPSAASRQPRHVEALPSA